MRPRYISAIEIGSSRIRGIVASVDDTSSISVLAVEEVDSGETVRYGRVQNAREAGALVNEIIRRLENNPRVAPGRISQLFVANGGRSVSSAHAEATVHFDGEAEITAQTLERLHNEARYNLATDRDVLAIAPRRFTVDNSEVKKIVGAFGKNIHGEFTIVSASPENRRALDRVALTSQGEEIRREYVTRLLAQSEMALTDSDRQLGCLLVDFGAETTTLVIFRDGALQAVQTLPMGSANITRDLSAGLSITAESAENIKITKGKAVGERVNMQAPDEQTREIINYVSARVGEIIANINAFIDKAGFKASELAAGAVVTGGGAKLNGFSEMLEVQTKLKVRPAAVDASIMMLADGNAADNFDMISLVKYAGAHSDLDCLSFPASYAEETEKAAASAPAPAQAPPRRRVPSLDDDDLLKDDLDDDELDQPDNINADTNLDDIPQEATAKETRKSLLKRLADWLAPQQEEDDMDKE